MTILAIDPSLRSTGICLFTGGKIKTETWAYKKDIKRIDIMSDLYWKIVNLYIDMQGAVDYMVIEDYAFSQIGKRSRGSASITPLAEVQGLLKGICAAHSSKVVVMSSQTWKSVVGWVTLPKMKKADIEYYISTTKKLFKKEFKTTDECDAYMIYLAFKMIVMKECRVTEGVKNIYKDLKEYLDGIKEKE